MIYDLKSVAQKESDWPEINQNTVEYRTEITALINTFLCMFSFFFSAGTRAREDCVSDIFRAETLKPKRGDTEPRPLCVRMLHLASGCSLEIPSVRLTREKNPRGFTS